MAITRKADARWQGGLQGGAGRVHLGSGAFEGAYSFNSRFGDGTNGTNPEELLGAAHSACFSMALSGALERAGHPATEVATTAAVTVDREATGFRITLIHLTTIAKVPGISADDFQKIAADAKATCPISVALAATPITLDATLAQ